MLEDLNAHTRSRRDKFAIILKRVNGRHPYSRMRNFVLDIAAVIKKYTYNLHSRYCTLCSDLIRSSENIHGTC